MIIIYHDCHGDIICFDVFNFVFYVALLMSMVIQ